MKRVIPITILAILPLFMFGSIPTDSLIAYYDFEADSIINTVDNQYQGVSFKNELSINNGILGNCHIFDGDSSKVEFFKYQPGSFSLNIWFNTFDTEKIQRIIHKGGRGGSILNPYSFSLLYLDNKIRFSIGDSNGGNAALMFSDPIIEENQWYMLTTTFDSITNETKLYINGIEHATAISTNQIILTEENLELSYYPTFDVDHQHINGYLDEFGIWNTTLTEMQIEELYAYYNDATGVKELEEETFINVYPVPSSDFVNITFENSASKNITIYNIQGEAIRSEANNSLVYTLDIRDYRSGLYLVRIQDISSLKISTTRIVKN